MDAWTSFIISVIAMKVFSVPLGTAFAAAFVVGLLLQWRGFRDFFDHLHHLHEYETLDSSAWTKMGD